MEGTRMSLEELPVPHLPSATAAPVGPHPTPVRPDARLDQVLAITREMFGSEPSVEAMFDPEDPDETPFVSIDVRCQGEPKELVQRQLRWHERTGSLNADFYFRLSIIPVV